MYDPELHKFIDNFRGCLGWEENFVGFADCLLKKTEKFKNVLGLRRNEMKKGISELEHQLTQT